MASLTSLPPKMQSTPESTFQWTPKKTTIDLVGGIRCNICHLTFASKKDYDSHYVTHGNATDIIYTCNICYKEIAGYPSFRGHCYTNHVIKERFKCEHCTKQFSKFSTLKEHINVVHKFKCPSCSKEFPSKKELQLHQIIHSNTDQPPYECNTCKTDIDTVDECKDHVEMHIEYLYSCPICNEYISDKAAAVDHFKEHFGDEPAEDGVVEKGIRKSSEETFIEQLGGIFCEFCSSVLKNRVEFDAHFSCEHGDEDIVYMCVVCGKTFEKYSVFYNHCYNHTSKKRYECDICQKSFPRMSLLATHRAACQQAGATNGKPFACTVCEHRFGCEGRWREHLREVHGQHCLPCTHRGCEQVFDTPKQLLLHQQSHDITIRHFCSQCRLVLANVSACERHMELHRKKIYFCPVCKRNYKEKYVIMNHVSQHFETVLHLCKVCGKVYNARARLVEHMKSHLNVKSHSCKYCDKSFTKLLQLNEHMNTHTGSKPYKCPVCMKTFASYPNWYKHVRRMHHDESIRFKNPMIANKKDDNEENSKNGMAAVESKLTENAKEESKNDELIANTDNQIPIIDNQMANTDTIANITNHSDNTDCLSDIDDANASIDFSNVKLENYIFSVGAIGVDNIPSIPDEKDLFNAHSEENSSLESNLFNSNAEENVAIDRNLFHENNGENIVVGEFNENGVENVPVGKNLFNGSVEENASPVDILEYIAEMPDNNSLFVPVIPQEPLGPCAVQAAMDAGYPCEYGPEFSGPDALGALGTLGVAGGSGTGFVDLDDHILPHIDPLLTIKNETCTKMYAHVQNDVGVAYDSVPKWEPIITRLYDECAYQYADVGDSGRLSMMNTDIF